MVQVYVLDMPTSKDKELSPRYKGHRLVTGGHKALYLQYLPEYYKMQIPFFRCLSRNGLLENSDRVCPDSKEFTVSGPAWGVERE